MAENSRPLVWHRARACNTSACVDVAFTADAVLVRDSENPSGAYLRFNSADWRAFIAGLRIETLSPPLD